MKTLRVHFFNWSYPGGENNIILYTLKRYYNVLLDSVNPDVVFYQIYNYCDELPYKNCIKIFVTGEPGPWTRKTISIYPPDNRSRKSFEDAVSEFVEVICEEFQRRGKVDVFRQVLVEICPHIGTYFSAEIFSGAKGQWWFPGGRIHKRGLNPLFLLFFIKIHFFLSFILFLFIWYYSCR